MVIRSYATPSGYARRPRAAQRTAPASVIATSQMIVERLQRPMIWSICY
jgi:hypothetical protein